MAYFPETGIYLSDTPSIDAFDRLRVSEPFTVFDSKQLWDKGPLFWDEVITTGTGTPTSTHSTTDANVSMTVDNTGDVIVRQTFMRFNYQPGKSQLVLLTGVISSAANITARVGLFDGDDTSTAPSGSNGLFFEAANGVLSVVKRKNGTDTKVAQSSWNIDTFDGNGPSGVTLDPTKTQIMVIDYEWLGVGRVRMGFVIDGIVYYCHYFNHANTETSVYMSTPNLPIRYEISSQGGSGTLQHICSSVMSEGGLTANGRNTYFSTAGTHVDANTADTLYAVVGLRLKSTHLDSTIVMEAASTLAETNDNYEWVLLMNPTVAGTFTYSDITNSSVQGATGATANTVTGGYPVAGGFGTQQTEVAITLETPYRLGSAIDGTPDEMVLCVRPLSANLDVQGGLTWKELL